MNPEDDIAIDPKLGRTSGIGPTGAPGPASRAVAVEASAGLSSSAEIAAALASGRITSEAATDLLIQQVLAEQGAGLDAAAAARLETELRELLADDPTLARLLHG